MAKCWIGILIGDDIGLEIEPVAVQVLLTSVKRYEEIKLHRKRRYIYD